MDLPLDIQSKIDELLDGYKLNDLRNTFLAIQKAYKNEERSDKSLVDSEIGAKVYASYRMPATFGALIDVYAHMLELYPDDFKTILDVGGGSGSSSLASALFYKDSEITTVEKSKSMYEVGKKLTEEYKNINWVNADFKDYKGDESDLVISSYMLNELNEKSFLSTLDKLWSITKKCLIIVESGDKKGSEIIQKVRNHLLFKGGYILAPCPHMNKCPIKEDDWCHFATRVSRSKLHRLIKDGEVPYEDEKYSYIVFFKEEVNRCNARIMRHPLIYNNFIKLTLCDKEDIKEVNIYKSDKEKFKKSKKLKAGDTI